MYQRQVMICDFSMYSTVHGMKNTSGATAKFPSHISVTGFYDIVKSLFSINNTKTLYQNKRRELRIQDIKQLDAGFCMLVNSTVADGGHHVSRDFVTESRRELDYEATEGPETSSHVIFLPNENDDAAIMLLEKGSGFPVLRAISFFNSLLKRAVRSEPESFKEDHPLKEVDVDGQLKKSIYVPKVDITGHVKESFFEDIENGTVSSIELISDTPSMAGVDVPDAFKSWRVQVAKASNQERYKDYLPEVLGFGRDFKMDRLRIKFKDSTNATHTKEIDVDQNGTTLDNTYILTKNIELTTRPRSSYTEAKDETIRLMLECYEDEKH